MGKQGCMAGRYIEPVDGASGPAYNKLLGTTLSDVELLGPSKKSAIGKSYM